MTTPAAKSTVALTAAEIALLVKSLDHCIATCKTKSKSGGPCADCDAARALKRRLQKTAKA